MNRKQIEERLAAIREDIEKRGAELTTQQLETLEAETNELIEKRNALIEAESRRASILASVSTGDGTVTRSFSPSPTPEQFTAGSPEYRSAWLNTVRQIELTSIEKRAFANVVGSGAEVIPTQTANEILTKVKKLAPMLGEITLLHVNGAVRYAVEGVNNEAVIHAENTTITVSDDMLSEVHLSGFEIVKLVRISKTVKQMSIAAFEQWLTDSLADAISKLIEKLIINGTGVSQPKGLDKAATWNADNSVSVNKAGKLTAENVYKLVSLLPAGYDVEAKFVMSKKTLYTDFLPLQDSAKNSLVTLQNGTYYILGYPVLVSDYVTTNEAFLGAFRKVVGNLAEDITINSAYDIDTNSFKFSATALFDCTPALSDAVVKLIKLTA